MLKRFSKKDFTATNILIVITVINVYYSNKYTSNGGLFLD